MSYRRNVVLFRIYLHFCPGNFRGLREKKLKLKRYLLQGVEDRLPSELSGGMKKRVALARSIIFDTTKDVIEPEVCLERLLLNLLIFTQLGVSFTQINNRDLRYRKVCMVKINCF